MQNYSSTTPLYVPIDIGKNVNVFAAYQGHELVEINKPIEVRNNRKGYQYFRCIIQGWLASSQYTPVILGLEPTGVYHEPWAYAIHNDFGDHILFRLLNPYQTKQQRRKMDGGRNFKTDAIDVKAMAYCLRDGLGNPAWLRQGVELQFDVWAATYRQVNAALFRLHLSLISQIDRLWPGAIVDVKAFEKAHPTLEPPVPFVLSRPIERRLIQTIFSHEPNPYAWKGRSSDQIQATIRQFGVRCGPKTAQTILQLLDEALFVPEPMAILLATRMKMDFAQYLALQERMQEIQQQAEDLVPNTIAAVLTSIPGISNFLAAQYLAYIISPFRFNHPDEIWCLAGFDVNRDDSGDRRKIGRISKRGDPGLRRLLFQIGLNTSVHCPPIAAAKRRALSHGKDRIGAVLHAAHKANRLCFTLLKEQTLYDPLRHR
jgi:transposase